ncbi:unnamed protein product [Somion occarium]|uniref:Uncharacterized protein n=1 Tax=Somion occarium TaxID=3059160 RepID=A0ABP1E1F0_9APHY
MAPPKSDDASQALKPEMKPAPPRSSADSTIAKPTPDGMGSETSKSLYAWDTTTAGVYGQFIKPVAINESKFRLVDQLYEVTEIIGAPNSLNLFIIYDEILNNLLPAFQSPELSKQQNEIQKWLLKKVKAQPWIIKLLETQQSRHSLQKKAPQGAASALSKPTFAISNKLTEEKKINHLELSTALYEEYLYAKQIWELETLAHTTAVRQAQLVSKWGDAIVRGYYHNVREYMGYMDIKSASEALQDAKDSLREAAMSSLDGAMKVYPVQLSPIDWFEGLSTSFTMEDLTENSEVIKQQIDVKSQQLDMLNAQLAALIGNIKGNVQELKQKVDAAQGNLDTAQVKLASNYTNNMVSMAKTCINAAGQLNRPQLDIIGVRFGFAKSIIDDLASGLQVTATANDNLTKAA